MRVPLARQNTFQHSGRAAVTAAGLAGVILLTFLQLGVLATARQSASGVYRMFDFDFAVTPAHFRTLVTSSVPELRLRQAAVVPGVAWIAPLQVTTFGWPGDPAQGEVHSLLIGVDPRHPVFADARLNARLPELRDGARALADEVGRPRFLDPVRSGRIATRRLTVDIVGRHRLGAGLLADGSLIVSRATLARYLGGNSLENANLGLVKLAPGADAAAALAALREALPADVAVITRAELAAVEENYFLHVKPVGIFISVGLVAALVAGILIVHQLLDAELRLRRREYALLRALGYGLASVWAVGARQALLLGALAYGPALGAAAAVFAAMRRLAGFPVEMTWTRALAVAALAAAVCVGCAVAALGSLRRIDPAELLRA